MAELEQKVDELLKIAKELSPPVKRIGVQEGESILLVPVEEISYITTRKEGGVEYHTVDGKTYVNFESITGLEKKLSADPKFMKVHKSYIVNLQQIETITTMSGGRDLRCKGWPEMAVRCSQDYVKKLEGYFKLKQE
jgi:DNA-binding LytR/AlgR family response regulator